MASSRQFRSAPLAIPLSAVLLLCVAHTATGQTWNGSVSDLWGTAGNWTPSTIPNSTLATVTISNTTNNPVLVNGSFFVDSLTVDGSNSLTVNSGDALMGGGTSTNNGTVDISSGGNLVDFSVYTQSSGSMTVGGALLSTGATYNQAGGSTTVQSGGTLQINAYSQTNGATSIAGTLDAGSIGGNLTISGGSFTVQSARPC